MFRRKESDGESSDEEMIPPPTIREDRRIAISAESMDPTTEESAEKIVIPKTEEQKKRINSSLKNNFLFRQLDEDQAQDLTNAMFEKKIENGTELIVQGAPGDFFYVVESGTFDIFVSGEKKAECGPGASFGELALLYNAPRAATVKATSESIVWALDRVSFRKNVNGYDFKEKTFI